MSKKTTIRLTKARKLRLDDVIEFAGVKYRITQLVLIERGMDNVRFNAIDIDAPKNLCRRHERECEVMIVLNKDRKIPVLK